MQCRPRCGACCIAPSISTPIPGMPHGKPAGQRCVQLADDNACRLFGLASRPAVCAGLAPGPDLCGTSRNNALRLLGRLECRTGPSTSRVR